MNKIEAYKELLATFNRLNEFIKDDYRVNVTGCLSSAILWMDLSEKFGVTINNPSDMGSDYCRLSNHQFIGLYGADHNRTISWPDDGKQPDNEWLYVISFPTGAYIFDKEYPQIIFQEFFNELKEYSPKYIDSANHNLYFTSEQSKEVHDDFHEVFKKYKSRVDKEIKTKKIYELQKELEKLGAAT